MTGGGRTQVVRRGDHVIRQSGVWTPSVHGLLLHLETQGFESAPRIVGSGFDADGREVLTYIEGESIHPHVFDDRAMIAIGVMLRKLHEATSNFQMPPNSIWRDWPARKLEFSHQVIGHCDFAPWNLITRNGLPVALIDWENAGPVDMLVELGQVCWLNAQLCDDDVANRAHLPSAAIRARQMRLIVDAYELPKKDRVNLLDAMISIAVLDAADQAIEANITFDSKSPEPLWGLAWRARAAAWMIKNRTLLEKALNQL